MKQQYSNYIEKMNKYNTFELKYLKALKQEFKLKRFFELMELAYKNTDVKKIEKIHKEKLQHLINANRKLKKQISA
ncbi:MAG: hypothetical protein U9R42_08130 [Bacteroidota bacterium]|nr:hypothetical protein [Bacteroidota bacterium]